MSDRDPSPPGPDDREETRHGSDGTAGGERHADATDEGRADATDEGRADATGENPTGDDAWDDWEWETEASPQSSEPLADLARDVRARDQSASEADELFESVDVDELDSETVWSSVEAADAVAGPGVATGAPDDEGTTVGDDEPVGDEQVVPRGDYCSRCEYLADPPTLACTREGTDIVEVVDHEQFLVRACPFVDDDPVAPADADDGR